MEYIDLRNMIGDLFEASDILILWGKRGKGKSSLAGKLMDEFMKPINAKQDVRNCKQICEKLNNAGFNFHPPTDHTVFCDTFFEHSITSKKKRTAYMMSGLDFALPNEVHSSLPLLPFGRYFLDETQDLFDSHIASLPTFVTKAMELSRHPHLFICLVAQRAKRIHKDIREIATFIEVLGLEHKYSKFGRLIKTTWTVNIIYDNANLERYLESREKKLVDRYHVKISFVGNIFKCYDSNFYLPLFYKGFKNADFVLDKARRVEYTPFDFDNYYLARTIDVPDSYRGKKPKEKK